MKKVHTLLSLIALFFFFSCAEDNTLYEPQEKENVNIDNINNEDKDEEEELPEGQLLPGMHIVKLNVEQPDGQVVERRFKYYMPIAAYGNPSLIFDFHGSYEFNKNGATPDPMKDFTISNPLVQLAIQENCIVCVPVGLIPETTRDTAYINWQESEKHLPFVDAMIEYFRGCTPRIDDNRIFSTGQSSGAIFSWVLAFERSEVFASIAPRAGQMNTDNQTDFPTRCVPVRVFAGEADQTVIHSAVISNTTAWAERIGGYFATSVAIDTFSITDYTKVTTRKWNGAKGDIEIYSLEGIGHGVSLSYCCPYMWEFWNSHTLDQNSSSIFISTSIKEIEAQCNELIEFSINYTDEATLTVDAIPNGWNFQLDGKKISMTGPSDFYGNIDREGEITFTISLNNNEYSTSIPYMLKAPKEYFEVGDLYYNENFELVGIVCWVNNANIREAKIISLKGPGSYENTWYCGSGSGLGLDFDTPDRNNGDLNTAAMIAYNNTLEKPFPASDAAFVWASSLGEGWYLPAIEELSAITQLDKLNAALKENGGSDLNKTLYSSTTKVEEGASKKIVYNYNFTSKQETGNTAKQDDSEYFGYIYARAMKKVTK